MKRISFWAVSTVSVLVLLFSYNTSTSSEKIVAAPAEVISSDSLGAAAESTPSQTPTQTETQTETQSPTQSPTQATPTTIRGDVVDTDEGPLQIELTVTAGEITGVGVVQYPTGNSQHEEINGRALPILIEETLDAQSADIDMVSGATATSTGYIGSLQSALDEAGL